MHNRHATRGDQQHIAPVLLVLNRENNFIALLPGGGDQSGYKPQPLAGKDLAHRPGYFRLFARQEAKVNERYL